MDVLVYVALNIGKVSTATTVKKTMAEGAPHQQQNAGSHLSIPDDTRPIAPSFGSEKSRKQPTTFPPHVSVGVHDVAGRRWRHSALLSEADRNLLLCRFPPPPPSRGSFSPPPSSSMMPSLRLKAARRLFPADSESSEDEGFEAYVRDIMEKQKKKYGFDFELGVPLPQGPYEFEEVLPEPPAALQRATGDGGRRLNLDSSPLQRTSPNSNTI